jgi:Domain of unknown function (DUF4129)
MTSDTKRKTLAFLAGVVILTAIIAVAMQRLELKPGVPLPEQALVVRQSQYKQELPRVVISVSNFWKAVVSIALLVAFIYISYRLLRSVNWDWKDVVKTSAYIIVLFLIAAAILWALISGRVSAFTPATETPPPSVAEESGPPLGPVPLSLIWIVGLGLAAALVGVGLWAILRPAGQASADRLTLQAEWALQELKKGLDLKNVIVRCYWQMGQVLQEEQGIEMETAMTVREFERLLESRGVPHLPVHQLTQLFETARYGHRATSAEDERQAVDALTTIAQYCRAARPSPSI